MICDRCRTANDATASHCTGCGLALPERRAGDVVGNYEVLRVLGQGGMGCVYEAKHKKLGRLDALKMLQRSYAASPERVQKFFAEARAVNRLKHENVVQIFDFIEGDENYYVMERLNGDDLATIVRRDGRLKLERALKLAEQLASALVAVHAVGLVHGDIKPDNVIVVGARGGERVKLFDFGLVAEDGERKHAMQGSPAYLAPEAFAKVSATPAVDVYAFGVVLFELIVGRRPFTADDLWGWKAAHENDAPPDPARFVAMPATLAELIVRCLAKQPSKRPAMSDAHATLRQILAAGSWEPPRAQPVWHRKALIASCVALFALILFVAVMRPKRAAPVLSVPASAPTQAITVAPIDPRPDPAPAPTHTPVKKKKTKRAPKDAGGVIDAFAN